MATLLTLLLLLPGPAAAQDDAPNGAATPAPAPPEFIFRSSSDPLGQGDDRTAGRIEEALTTLAPELGACRSAFVEQGGDPFRFLQLEVRLKGDGTFKKTKIVSSTGSDGVDACATAIVAGIRLDPPPMFNDRLLVNLVWAKPPKEDAPPPAPEAPAVPAEPEVPAAPQAPDAPQGTEAP